MTFGRSRQDRGPALSRAEFLAWLALFEAALDQPFPTAALAAAIHRVQSEQEKEPA